MAINNVNIFGPLNNRNEVGETIRKYDLFACPSIRISSGDMDGIPTSIVESMIAGVPVLTTSISGIPDLVEDGITGVICDPTPTSIAQGIKGFSFSPERRQYIVKNAKTVAIQKHDAKKLTRLMTRVWESRKIDVIMIGWKNLREHQEVLNRLYKYTALPFSVTVCANSNEDEDIRIYDKYLSKYANFNLIIPGYNAYVGPGTNKAIDNGSGDICVYLCGREGFILKSGWDLNVVHYMDDNPSVGVAGTLCYSPSYLTGKDYENIPLFEKFRNKNYAHENPNRVFQHVQGGLFALRRKMYDQIGGFSQEVPHSYTDVEYSYYVESMGWKLGELPGVLSLFNKTRPGLKSRIDSDIFAIHPGSLDSVQEFECISQGKVCNCNICGWSGSSFKCDDEKAVCPRCLSSSSDRKIFVGLQTQYI
ncbi:glycosyltransferase [Ochrobactrum tritici]|uniref:Glycosyltransferase n=1 Tax=Brucella tritici TaxID=94626 RepID=A0A7X6FPK0_9HYPH|nr:glycosyltransferase [Brucella tritici]